MRVKPMHNRRGEPARNRSLPNCNRQHSVPRAFTLIELLVSSVLAAMLMLAIVGLLRVTNAHSKAAERILRRHPATTILTDQIRRDFVNARHIEIRPQRVRLFGYTAQDWSTRRPTFRPAEVTYAIAAHRLGSTLVRQEIQRNKFVGKRSRTDLLWMGAAAIEVVRFDEPSHAAEGEDIAPSPPGMSPIPARLFVAIYDRDGEPLCTEEIFHHHAVN